MRGDHKFFVPFKLDRGDKRVSLHNYRSIAMAMTLKNHWSPDIAFNMSLTELDEWWQFARDFYKQGS
jgi:hypothetical protein